jgi:hypothetical protein
MKRGVAPDNPYGVVGNPVFLQTKNPYGVRGLGVIKQIAPYGVLDNGSQI